MSYFAGQVRTLTDIDVSIVDQLRTELVNNASYWDYWDKLKPNKFSVFENCAKHIVLKYPIDLSNHKVSATFPMWREWKDLIQPLIDHACETYQYENGGVARVMLAKLLPLSVIPLHVDASPSAELPHKIHIPLQTREEIVMNFNEGDYHLSIGHAYEVNNRIEHGVTNPTDSERIHLIFDYFEN